MPHEWACDMCLPHHVIKHKDLVYWWSLPWPFTTLRPPAWRWPSVWFPPAPGVLRLIRDKAPPCERFAPAKDTKVYCIRHYEAKVCQDPRARVSSGVGISVASGPHPQQRARVTCLAFPLAATQSLECQALEDSWSHRRLTIATGNKKLQKKSIPNCTRRCYSLLRTCERENHLNRRNGLKVIKVLF
jgi:hypothetical protein